MTDTVTSFEKKQQLEKMRTALESDRSSFITLWQQLNDFILPTRARFFLSQNNRGDRRSQKIVDSTATLAARTMASGMMSGITSPARQWFKLTTPDPDLAEFASVKEWLHTCTDRVRWVLSRSNFYNKAPLIYQDMGVFGTAGLLEIEDDHKVVQFIDMPVGSFCIGMDDSSRAAVLTREFRMSVRQLVKRFGIDAVSSVVKRHYDRHELEQLIEVVHVIHPREDYDPSALRAKDSMPVASCYYEKNVPNYPGRSAFLRESGFRMFPGMFPRWEVTGDDVYGTNSPGITALGDIKQLQQGEKLSLQAVEKMVKPPMVGPTALKHVRASTLPSDITYIDIREGQQGFRPAHEVRFDVDKMEFKQQQVRGRVDRAFFADLFLMLSYLDDDKPSRQPVTAAEIYERHEEKLLALGPVLEQLNQDLLDPIIDRTFQIMAERELLPPPPEEVQGTELKVEYISMMHQAQKSSELTGLRSTTEFVLSIADRDPSAMDVLDTDTVIRYFADSAGTPPDALVPKDRVDKIRQARAAEQKRARDAEALVQGAKATRDLAGADTGGPNALTDMMREDMNQMPLAPGGNA